MMRSGSRVAWQVLRHMTSTVTRPEDWDVPPEWIGKPLLDEVWPLRSHGYASKVPVIFTYRHPVEAFLSLKTKFMIDIGKDWIREGYDIQHAWKGAMKNTGEAWDVYRQLKIDSSNGRSVLFLRYEDYYEEPAKRIHAIAEFVNFELTEDHLQQIIEDTSVEINYARGKSMSVFHPEKPFSATSAANSGVQRDHVSPHTLGVPGKWLETQPDFINELHFSEQPAFQALIEMCEDMGYKI